MTVSDWSFSSIRMSDTGEGRKTRRCRRVTYQESYITKYTSIRRLFACVGNFSAHYNCFWTRRGQSCGAEGPPLTIEEIGTLRTHRQRQSTDVRTRKHNFSAYYNCLLIHVGRTRKAYGQCMTQQHTCLTDHIY